MLHFLNEHLLSLLIWLPITGAIACLITGDDRQAVLARWLALLTTLFTLILSIPLYQYFNSSISQPQFVERLPWISNYGIYYYLGIDGISMPMILLSNITSFVVVLASWTTIRKKVSQYMAAFLVMQGMMTGMFASLDSILFYIFWEAMLIPIYISIGVWGSENRSYASIKFFLYTFAGSALMLAALLYLHFKTNTFAILDFYPLKLSMNEQVWIFLALLLAFAVKIPMWPVHTWLPDAHTEAPAGGSVVLAALMLKMGVYGFLRFTMPIVPDACQKLHWLMIGLSLIAIVYIGLVALAQKDMKRLIAYSSIAHMGFATLGCFMVYVIIGKTGNHQDAYMSMEGSMVQMISHAFSTGALFVGIGILYDQMHSRIMSDYGGVASKMPVFSALYMLFCMANVGLPGTSGFVGEFMVILSAFKSDFWVALFAASTMVLSAAYTLWLYKQVFFGEIIHTRVSKLNDITGPNVIALVMLAFIVLLLGLYPEPLLKILHSSVANILQLSLTTKLI